MKISTPTGTCILLFVLAISIAALAPAFKEYSYTLSEERGVVAGVSVGGIIEPTPTNTLYSELEKERILIDQQQKTINAEKEYLKTQQKNNNSLLWSIVVLLFCMILINFYLDRKRARELTNENQRLATA